MSIVSDMKRFVSMGVTALVDLAMRDRLDSSHLWVALKGASRYVLALASGDVASEAESQERATECALCPHRHTRQTAKSGVVAGYCGRPLEPSAEKNTCGCLVTITIGFATRPAGKTLVDSEYCPQFRWKSGHRGSIPTV